MVNPGVPRDGKRVHILARELVVLEQILSVPHVPPDVRIIHALAVHRENELQNDQYQSEKRQERASSANPTAEPGPKRRVAG